MRPHGEYVHHDTSVCTFLRFALCLSPDVHVNRPTECSSKHNRGVSEVFYEVARVSLTTRAKGQSGGGRGCIVM